MRNTFYLVIFVWYSDVGNSALTALYMSAWRQRGLGRNGPGKAGNKNGDKWVLETRVKRVSETGGKSGIRDGDKRVQETRDKKGLGNGGEKGVGNGDKQGIGNGVSKTGEIFVLKTARFLNGENKFNI